ncbi:MAG: ComEC family competence protein [Candidatus Omnitrophica bacterium]|nr:ComEC family competence protein [Candidatus Omnitrophota bacterium]
MKNFYLFHSAAAFITGSLFARRFASSIPFYVIGIFVAILFLLLVLSIRKDTVFFILFILIVFSLGFMRYKAFNHTDAGNIKNYLQYHKTKVFLSGKIESVLDESRNSAKKTFTLEVRSIRFDDEWIGVNGFVLVNIYGEAGHNFEYGDIVVLEGFLMRPFSYAGKKTRFDYRKYLAHKRIYAVLNVKRGFFASKIASDSSLAANVLRGIYSMRDLLATRIERFLDPPHSAILTAILLGKRQKIPSYIKDLFIKTGTLHILAISGLHIGIIYFALRLILRIFRTGNALSAILAVLFLAFFTMLTGARPSILRATVMFSIFALGAVMKRKISVYNTIGLSCLVILIANPNQVFGTGFILSYTAVLSVVYITPAFYRLFSLGPKRGFSKKIADRFKSYILKSLSVSMAAWIGLLPLTAHYFGLFSPVVVIANIIVIPLLVLIMGCGILFISLGFLSPFLSNIIAQSIWPFILALIFTVSTLKKIPLSYVEMNPPGTYAILLYYVMLFIAVHMVTGKKTNFLFFNPTELSNPRA